MNFRRVGSFRVCLTFVLVAGWVAAGAAGAAPVTASGPVALDRGVFALVASGPVSSAALRVSSDLEQASEVQSSGGEVRDDLAAMRKELESSGFGDLLCGEPQPFAGSLADVLQSEAFANAVCNGQKNFEALAQGALSLQQALERGSDCVALDESAAIVTSYGLDSSEKSDEKAGPWMRACFSDVSIWAQRGGTMYGNTFLTPTDRAQFLEQPRAADIVRHEHRHFLQWRLLGKDFPAAYLIAGSYACENSFEIAAGLEDGGYRC